MTRAIRRQCAARRLAAAYPLQLKRHLGKDGRAGEDGRVVQRDKCDGQIGQLSSPVRMSWNDAMESQRTALMRTRLLWKLYIL